MRSLVLKCVEAIVAAVLLTGCGGVGTDESITTGKDAGSVSPKDSQGKPGHTHEGGDVLFWERPDIEHEGFTIQLGHHGINVHAGHPVEPAVSITRDGADVGDAKVFNSLVTADKTTVLAEEVATVFEPATGREPAHYAQGELDVPENVQRVIIRYRIVLPSDAGEVSYDVPVDVKPH